MAYAHNAAAMRCDWNAFSCLEMTCRKDLKISDNAPLAHEN